MKFINNLTVRSSWMLVIAFFVAVVIGVGGLGLYSLSAAQQHIQLLAAAESEAPASFAATAALLRSLMIAAIVATLLMSAVVMRGVTVNVIRPLERLVSCFERMTGGDLSTIPPHGADNDIGRLFEALGAMQQSLVATVSTVRTSSAHIEKDAHGIASDNTDLSSRTEQQAASLEQTAASMEQLTSTVTQNADNSRQASSLAREATETARRGDESIGEVRQTMAGINDSARQMGEIVGLIDSIAFQTNILALNASVEAARAGEQGKGFAVVASEVRALAGRSASAAADIRELIDTSIQRVDTGSTRVEQASDTMKNVVESIERVSELISEIASASQEQSSGISQVNQAVSQIDKVTQQNGELVQSAARAAGELERQAANLRNAVVTFSLPPGSEQQSGAPRQSVTHGTTDQHDAASAALPAAQRTGQQQSSGDERTYATQSSRQHSSENRSTASGHQPKPQSRSTQQDDEWETF
ncbi:methyl-accepting chemotaxis protein [Kushneria aurantia]|uniref:Methyl-accepting chemotaxis protein n=1 Tax=Kushneria aurantia TaxID=504092 RepID=A0ABV6G0F6_9GAMM|nr:methyl-accepting chemotaxis protein [Kushneria aurantia]